MSSSRFTQYSASLIPDLTSGRENRPVRDALGHSLPPRQRTGVGGERATCGTLAHGSSTSRSLGVSRGVHSVSKSQPGGRKSCVRGETSFGGRRHSRLHV